VRDALRQTDGTGVILGRAACLPLDVPDVHLQAVLDAARAWHP
jgi:hypothetical protein